MTPTTADDVVAALAEALEEAADDCEAYIRAEYGWPKIHPAMEKKYGRDMQDVERWRRVARAALRDAREGR